MGLGFLRCASISSNLRIQTNTIQSMQPSSGNWHAGWNYPPNTWKLSSSTAVGAHSVAFCAIEWGSDASCDSQDLTPNTCSHGFS